MKWLLLLMVFLPDGKIINAQGNDAFTSQKACMDRGDIIAKGIVKDHPGVKIIVKCEDRSLPGEHA